MPKIVPKSIQTCFERVLGQTFRKFFAQFSTAFRILEKFQKNQKKISKFQKRPKSFPKESKRVLIVIWDNFFRKVFAQFSMEGQVFENFQKNQKRFKFPKMPKIVPKSMQTCFGRVWGKLSENFCPVFHGMSSLQKFSKKNIFKIPKMPKSVPKRIQTCFRVIFSKKFNAQCSMEGRVFENFQKKSEKFQNSKNAQNCCQKYPNVF